MTQYISKEAQYLATLVYPYDMPVINFERQPRSFYSDIFSDREELYRDDIQKLLDDPTFYSISSPSDSSGFDLTVQRMETDSEYEKRIEHERACLAAYNKRREKWQHSVDSRIKLAEEHAIRSSDTVLDDPEYKDFLRLMKKFVYDAS